jgi:hypothetical protein
MFILALLRFGGNSGSSNSVATTFGAERNVNRPHMRLSFRSKWIAL